MNYELIAKKIEAAGLGQIGKSIFIDSMPAEVKRGILIKSPIAGVKIDHELPGWYKPRLQIIVRSQTHLDGSTLSNAISNLFMTKQETIWRDDSNNPVFLIKHILPESLPIVYPRSDGNGLEFSINFDFCYVAI